MSQNQDIANILDDMLKKAKAKGADAADAVAATAISLSHEQRLGKMESLERSEAHDLGLRVIIGKSQAIVSSNDWKEKALDELVDRAISMAKTVPEDPYIGLADPDMLFTGDVPDYETFDPEEPSAETLVERAKTCENAALAVEGVTNSEGASASWSSADIFMAASNGFSAGFKSSSSSVGVSVIAGEGTGMETDYDYSSKVWGSDLADPAEVGKSAGDRAIKKLNPRKGPTIQAPVIFDTRVSMRMVGSLLGAINGSSIARGTSFLKDSLNTQVMNKAITLKEDPHRLRGYGSKAFDAEGLPTNQKNIVDEGMLTTWIMDLRTARQLGMESTGNASRGAASAPSPSTTNTYIEAGELSPEELIKDIKSGFYVTSIMGHGANMITGDYSQGAAGFWIEDGEIVYPVNEMTIAGNLKDMFLEMTPANNLTFRYGTDAPTLRIEGMTIAGA
ncbi:TldD/PmbA family protein [Curvivirga sp.]|uniref:TldD/PmbA family protein n=1 Tax=Curvivirga sp. TaxID=2856848 RepID=UPI003B59CFB8